jgi:peroxiredoxin Q/BCP
MPLSTPRVGDLAPDFPIPQDDGTRTTLASFRGQAEVVLFFYPKDDSPGCTAEACSFRDQYQAFRDAGAEVIGVSPDSAESHRLFAERHRLPYRLLTDSDGTLRTLYGVPKTLGLIPGRVTYLIDRSGTIRHVFSSQFRPAKHVEEALRVLAEIRAESGTNSSKLSPSPEPSPRT